jgi:hypothetical protein
MKNIFRILACMLVVVIFAQADYAKPKEEDYSIAYINDYEGECELKKKGESIGEEVSDIYISLYQGDTVITESDSRMEIVFDDATIMKLDSNSKLVIKNLKRGKTAETVLELIKGKIFGVVKKLTQQEQFTVKTKMAMAAVKGTELIVEAGNEDKVGVYEGSVEVSNIDMSGNVLSKVILDKNKEVIVVKHLKGPGKITGISRNFAKKYNEITDLRKKIQYLRELRRTGKAKEYRLERRLKRIQNLKMLRSNPASMKNVSPDQKALLDEIIKQEDYYQAQYDSVKSKERKTKSRIKQYLQDKKDSPQEEETPEE